MPKKRKTWYALLGLLSWQPLSGYDVKKMVEIAFSYFWSESYGQLYPTLNRLVEEGLATREDMSTGNRPRNEYRITAKGREAFEEWLREPADMPAIRNELQLKFFLTSRMDPAESVRILEEYRAQQLEHLEILEDSERILSESAKTGVFPREIEEAIGLPGSGKKEAETVAHQSRMFLFTLRHGLLRTRAAIEWCDETLASLNPMKGERKKMRTKGARR